MMKVVDKILEWENAGKTKLLSVGYSLRPPELLFKKIEDEEVSRQVEKLESNKTLSKNDNQQGADIDKEKNKLMEQNKTPDTPSSSPSSPPSSLPAGMTRSDGEMAGGSPIAFEDFAKIDLKVGTIITAEKVEKADKLLKLEIDLGFEKRIIVSGIALHFKSEEIIGKQVVVVANLAPRKMRGIESNGMILMAEDKDGKLYFVSPEEKISEGSSVT
ncbi:MAG: methionine--tRNA ligase subunit beta [Ginsengibacter sp.]